jgi:hypothetical protein
MEKQTFTLTEEHIKLLRRAYIGWESCEFGAPAIDCKRPYGNSDVYGDIAEILGVEFDADSEDEPFTDEQRDRFRSLHQETRTALQVILATGSFDPGHYEAARYDTNWRRVA